MIILGIIVIFLILLFCYCCCVVAGRADEYMNKEDYYEFRTIKRKN